MKLAIYTNKHFINYSIVCIRVIEVRIKDKIYEACEASFTKMNVLSIVIYLCI